MEVFPNAEENVMLTPEKRGIERLSARPWCEEGEKNHMPTTYTHYRFGDRCIAGLPAELQEAIYQFRGLYDIGVHGPDLFFYYHPLKGNPVSQYGSQLHQLPARTFFERAKPVWERCGGKKEMLVYLLGFLSHFVLDSTCHGYVEEARKALGISHNKLEALFDAYMMKEDSQIPSRVNRGVSLKPTAHRAEVISRFFDFPADIVLEAGKGQAAVMRLLYSPFGGKRRLLCFLIRLLHLPGSFDDLFVENEIPEEYEEAMSVLAELFAQAQEEYTELAENLIRYFLGMEKLSDRFDCNFE